MAKIRSNKTTYLGIPFKSKMEADYAQYLHVLELAGEVARWHYEGVGCSFPCIVNNKLITTYLTDFYVRYSDGREVWVEVKGFPTEVWRLRWKLVKACYPDTTFELVKKVPKIK